MPSKEPLITLTPQGTPTLHPQAVESGAAAQQLWLLEQLVADLEQDLTDCSAKLEALRVQGKQNTVKFREQMQKKLMSSHVLMVLRTRGLCQ